MFTADFGINNQYSARKDARVFDLNKLKNMNNSWFSGNILNIQASVAVNFFGAGFQKSRRFFDALAPIIGQRVRFASENESLPSFSKF